MTQNGGSGFPRTPARFFVALGHLAAPGEVAFSERPVPEPGPDEVLVETRASAISAGTELLVYRGLVADDAAVDPTLEGFDDDFSFPVAYGYAAVGTVTACGANVDEAWHGREVFGFNPHETHFVAAPESLVPVPPSLSVEATTLLPLVSATRGREVS